MESEISAGFNMGKEEEKRTASLCIPSSCIGPTVCRSQQQAAHIAHQIARAAIYYQISEIVIYDVPVAEPKSQAETGKKKVFFEEEEKKTDTGPKSSTEALELAKLLQFFITPSYLRKAVFGDLKSLHYAKKLPKLPGLPFMNHEKSRFLEGFAVEGRIGKKKKKGLKSKKQLALESMSHYINVGGKKIIKLSDGQKVPLHSRVTVDTEKNKVVSPAEAYNTEGSGWKNTTFGYTVRLATTFGKTFVESPYTNGYSYTAYAPCEEFLDSPNHPYETIKSIDPHNLSNPTHLLLIFGKWADLAYSVENDQADLQEVQDPALLFDARLNISSNIRLEDAILISLAKIQN